MRERHSVDTLDMAETETQGAAKSDHSQEERYIETMRPLQFGENITSCWRGFAYVRLLLSLLCHVW